MRELALMAVVLLGASAHAEAQRETVLLGGAAVRLSPYDQDIYNTAAAESDAATGLYVTTAVAGGLALVSLVSALGTAMAGLFTVWDYTTSSGYVDSTEGLLINAASLGILAAVSLSVAIGLSVDAGSRRRALTQRYRVALSPGGIALTGEF